VAKRKKHAGHEEEHENHERWLVSYADFITLLFAFFVVLYSVSRVDQKRVVQAEQSMRWAMHFSGEGGVSKMAMFDGPPSEGGLILNMSGGAMGLSKEQAVENVRRRVENRIRPFVMERKGAGSAVAILVEGSRVTIRLATGEFFDSGSAAIRPSALPIIDAIAAEIVPLARPLRIEGHTDEVPFQGDRFRDNWELSASRAAAVVSYLAGAHRATPELLGAIGYGSTRPVVQGTDEEALRQNRRVEMVVEIESGEAQPKRQ
jgi:chemotaxis protein MotB